VGFLSLIKRKRSDHEVAVGHTQVLTDYLPGSGVGFSARHDLSRDDDTEGRRTSKLQIEKGTGERTVCLLNGAGEGTWGVHVREVRGQKWLCVFRTLYLSTVSRGGWGFASYTKLAYFKRLNPCLCTLFKSK
jgi:hypothetical protein